MFMDAMNLDETVAQLLVAEGFYTLEEVAFVELDEITSIEGFNEETAEDLQARARESLEEANAAAVEKARSLGAEAALIEFEGLSPHMLQALAESGILTLEEFATCADWELSGGYTEGPDGKRVKDEGILERFDVSEEEARNLILNARVACGMIDPADLVVEEEAEEEAAETAETEAEPAPEGDA